MLSQCWVTPTLPPLQVTLVTMSWLHFATEGKAEMKQYLRKTLIFNSDLEAALMHKFLQRIEIHGEGRKRLKVKAGMHLYSKPNQ